MEPQPPHVPSSLPPLVAPADGNQVFSTMYADNDCLLIGDTHGRIRVRALMPASKVGSSSKAAKLAGLQLDGDGASLEYLNKAKWSVPAMGLKNSPLNLVKSPARGSSGGSQQSSPSPAARNVRVSTRITHLARDGDRVFAVQLNGVLTSWSLRGRDAAAPLRAHQLPGAALRVQHTDGTLMISALKDDASDSKKDTPTSTDYPLSVLIFIFSTTFRFLLFVYMSTLYVCS